MHFSKMGEATRLAAKLEKLDDRMSTRHPGTRDLSTRAMLVEKLREASITEAERKLENWRCHLSNSGLQAHQVYGSSMRGHSSSLKLQEGVSPEHPTSFGERTKEYYRHLYTSEPTDERAQKVLVRHVKKLTERQIGLLEEPMTLVELAETVNTMADNSPGPDGRTLSFWKATWGDSGPMILDLTRSVEMTGVAPDEMLQGLIRLLPKEGNSLDPADYRPITLLQLHYDSD